VRNAFAAKQAPGPVNRTFGLVVGALSLLAVAAIGIYFWMQLKPPPGLARQGVLTVAHPGQPVAPQETPAAAPVTPAVPPPMASTGLAASTTPAREVRNTAAARAQAGSRTDGGIHVATSRAAINPTLQQAYEALQAGDLAAAKAAYGRALDSEPRNIDALQALAAIALREGRSADAGSYYLRALEADPRDGAALAGLIGLNGQSDPVAGESRIKTLLAAQPDLPVLHFALGNLYARQNRWSDAQQAYFKACSGEPDNPDYLFNLAVSLDQLHQAAPAAQYYQKALTAAAARPAGFDRGQAGARLRELQP
jgi:Tfp pilus assembly protein PilF